MDVTSWLLFNMFLISSTFLFCLTLKHSYFHSTFPFWPFAHVGSPYFLFKRSCDSPSCFSCPWCRRRGRGGGESVGRDGGEWGTIEPDPFYSPKRLGPNTNQGSWAPGTHTYFLLPFYIPVHCHVVGSAVSTLLYFQILKGKLRRLNITSRGNNRDGLPDFD